jgi:hypothetical protein
MYAGAGLSAAYGIAYGVAAHATLVANGTHTSAYNAGFLFGAIFEGLLQSGLWLWMAWKTKAGRNWARVLSTVFFGLLSLWLIAAIFVLPAVSKTIIVAEWIVGLSALILLWQRESGQFFAAAKQARLGYFAPPQPGYQAPAQPYGQAIPFGQQPPQYGQPQYGQSPQYGQPPQWTQQPPR